MRISDILNLRLDDIVRDGDRYRLEIVEQKTAQAARKPDYAMTRENIFYNWRMLGVFIVVFALAATLVLEMIDHDKR